MTNPNLVREKEANVEYVTKAYGVYAVIPDEKKEKIFLVQAPNKLGFSPRWRDWLGNHQTAPLNAS